MAPAAHLGARSQAATSAASSDDGQDFRTVLQQSKASGDSSDDSNASSGKKGDSADSGSSASNHQTGLAADPPPLPISMRLPEFSSDASDPQQPDTTSGTSDSNPPDDSQPVSTKPAAASSKDASSRRHTAPLADAIAVPVAQPEPAPTLPLLPLTFSANPDNSADADPGGSSSDSHSPQSARAASQPGDSRVDTPDTPPSSPGPVAFEAKIAPVTAAPAQAEAAQPAPKQTSTWTPSDSANPPVRTAPDSRPANFLQNDSVPQAPPAPASPAPETHPSKAEAPELPAASRLQEMVETPAAPPAPSHSLTVNVPDASSDAGVLLHFVDRGGEIHVSVRTPDAQLAQDLRGGLNDLSGRLAHAGFRAEISTASAGESSMQRDTQQQPSDSRDSGRRAPDPERDPRDAPRRQQSRWDEAFEDTSKEQLI